MDGNQKHYIEQKDTHGLKSSVHVSWALRRWAKGGRLLSQAITTQWSQNWCWILEETFCYLCVTAIEACNSDPVAYQGFNNNYHHGFIKHPPSSHDTLYHNTEKHYNLMPYALLNIANDSSLCLISHALLFAYFKIRPLLCFKSYTLWCSSL